MMDAEKIQSLKLGILIVDDRTKITKNVVSKVSLKLCEFYMFISKTSSKSLICVIFPIVDFFSNIYTEGLVQYIAC